MGNCSDQCGGRWPAEADTNGHHVQDAYLVKAKGHGAEVIEQGKDDDGPGGHFKVEDDNGEKEEEADEERAGYPVDDIGLQAPEDLAAVHNGGDDGGNALLRQDDVCCSLCGPC